MSFLWCCTCSWTLLIMLRNRISFWDIMSLWGVYLEVTEVSEWTLNSEPGWKSVLRLRWWKRLLSSISSFWPYSHQTLSWSPWGFSFPSSSLLKWMKTQFWWRWLDLYSVNWSGTEPFHCCTSLRNWTAVIPQKTFCYKFLEENKQKQEGTFLSRIT